MGEPRFLLRCRDWEAGGIPRREYLYALSYFVFAETCEWVFVGNKHGREDCPYFSRYLRAALQMARALERSELLF